MCNTFVQHFHNKNALKYRTSTILQGVSVVLAEWTGLEPATPGVTGQCANQLRYHYINSLWRKL